MTLPLLRCAVLAAFALPCTVQAVDLVQAYEMALRHDPAKLAADEAVTAGREKSVQGDAMLRPRVGFQADVSRVDTHTSANVPPALVSLLPSHSAGTIRRAAIQLTQPIYDASARAEKKQLHQQAALAETEFVEARQELARRVAEVYFGVLSAQEALRVTLAEKSAVALQRDRAEARFNVGRGKITDLQEARARYDQVLTKEINDLSTLELRRAQFEQTTGLPGEELAPLADDVRPKALEPDNLQAWQLKGEEQSTAVRVRSAQLKVAEAEIDKYRASGRPKLALVASYTGQGQSGGLSPLAAPSNDRNAVIGLQFSVPLYSGGALNSLYRESGARKREAQQLLVAAKRDVRIQVHDAYLTVRTGLSRISSSQQALLSARTALEATTLGRDLGTRTELDVLDAQQRAFAAELDAVQAQLNYLLGRIRLATTAGESGESELRTLNRWLSSH